MTLTTIEELKRLASSDNANELTRRLARECLANREAQPVGFRYRHKDTVSWLYNDWRWPDSVEAEQCQIEWLYTAPPAPAVPDGWKLVPIDATRAMIDAAKRVEEDGYDAMHKAMLAAAPKGVN